MNFSEKTSTFRYKNFGSVAGALALLLMSGSMLAAAPRFSVMEHGGLLPLVKVQMDGIDMRPASELANDELRARLEILRRMVRNDVPGAEEMLRADRQELKRRSNGEPIIAEQPVAEQPAPELPVAEQPVAEQPEPAKRRRERAVAEQPDQPVAEQPVAEQPVAEQPEPTKRRREKAVAEQPQPVPEQPVVQQPVAPQPAAEQPQPTKRQREKTFAEQPVIKGPQPMLPKAERRELDPRIAILLTDNRPAGRLNDAQLRERIAAGLDVLQSADRRMPRQLLGQITAMVQADQAELSARIQATTGTDVSDLDANREARRVLSDARPAARLNEHDLRERVQALRTVLNIPGLAPRFENELRAMLQNDRNELRSRVSQREEPRARQRQSLDGGSGRVQQGEPASREEFRRRLLEERAGRQRRLANRENAIVIDRRLRPIPLPTIPLAEAYDEDVQRQLVAPPVRTITRRYSLSEYKATPALRSLMPGIEVDTVKFGFNEDFVRESEVDKLDRIGEIIERILAGNPNEVFLIEGHTDLVGSATYNGALSLRRAAAIRDALTTFFYIPVRNIEIVGYGEEYPRIPTEFEEPENRRVTIRRITPILTGSR
ncbi:MAG: OmpA family protein [Nitratireductor sp.]